MTLFATTRWSLLLDLKGDGRAAHAALEQLCRAYRRPVIVFLRKQGYSREDAEDAAQAFFAHLIEHRSLERAERDRGRFRSFLLAALKQFLGHQRDAANAQKRGGGQVAEALDSVEERDLMAASALKSPEGAFDLVWALTVLDRALAALRAEAEQSGKLALFETLREYVVEPAERSEYAEAAAKLSMRANTVAVVVHRLRARLRELIEGELSETVGNAVDLKTEMTALRQALVST
jgi:RNA polymerase sigma-70 factor (ECF subfamily)